jgi:hypothetical protein
MMSSKPSPLISPAEDDALSCLVDARKAGDAKSVGRREGGEVDIGEA